MHNFIILNRTFFNLDLVLRNVKSRDAFYFFPLFLPVATGKSRFMQFFIHFNTFIY